MVNKLKRLAAATLTYEKKALANYPSWLAEVATNAGRSTVIGAKHFIKNHKETTSNLLKKLSPELGEVWEALQDVVPIPEEQKVTSEEFMEMVIEQAK